ncbi:hypothetical protein HCN44_001651 [Aphidius gifuensis]|uniref:Odorant-binding protein n=2 Tax=Aphidius gifuensis TaxID=684658 RepID=A0A834XWY5_APHGI|nr:hypothetical protein HCN44_001651 [Aphidius gifuensis]
MCWLTLQDVKALEKVSSNTEPDFITPEYILPCSRKDPAIDSCIQTAFNHLRPYLINGISELDLPPIEPLIIPELKMQNGQGGVRVIARFSNISAIGPGNYTIRKVRSDLKSLRLDLHLNIPRIELQGHYEVAGNVLVFPIQSHGDFWAVFGDVNSVAKVQGDDIVRDGIHYMKIARLVVDFKLGSSRFKVADHLNGNNVIGQAMNQFLNDNSKEIIDEMRPAASASIAKHFKSFLNTAFTKVPLKVWLHD